MVHLFLVTTAPPSDALLFIKVQFDMMLFSPTIWIAPESFLAELSINLQFEMVVCFSNRMAPPLDALLFIKVQFDMMLFSPTIWTAPEDPLAELSINLQFEITTFEPQEYIAPPSDEEKQFLKIILFNTIRLLVFKIKKALA